MARRRPRPPRRGTWTLVTPARIRAWRDQHGVPRAAMAALLGVSPGSILNWEIDHVVATPALQSRLANLLAGPPPREPVVLRPASEPDRAATLEAVGMILAAYLPGAPIELDDLPELVSRVRAALA